MTIQLEPASLSITLMFPVAIGLMSMLEDLIALHRNSASTWGFRSAILEELFHVR